MKKTANVRRPVDLYLLGAGVSFPDHLTVQTLEILSSCRRICTILPDERLEGLPRDIRAKCTSLWPLYQDRRLRSENYRDVTQAVVEIVRAGAPVGWLTSGHPRVFDSVSTALIGEAKARGWNAVTVPAISCFDTLLAEVGFDPAGGLVVYEATGLVRQAIPVIPTAGMFLLQPSVFDSNRTHLKLERKGPDLSPLRDYLLRFFPGEHDCAFVRSALNADDRASAAWVKLKNLASVPHTTIAGSTLFVSPLDAEKRAKPARPSRG